MVSNELDPKSLSEVPVSQIYLPPPPPYKRRTVVHIALYCCAGMMSMVRVGPVRVTLTRRGPSPGTATTAPTPTSTRTSSTYPIGTGMSHIFRAEIIIDFFFFFINLVDKKRWSQ